MKRIERLMLEEMSLKAYGSKTRYKKMMEQGVRMKLKDDEGREFEGYQRFDIDEIQAVMAEEIEEKKKKAEEESARAAEQPALENNNV